MCGIFGISDPCRKTGFLQNACESMRHSLYHRGPNDFGYCVRTVEGWIDEKSSASCGGDIAIGQTRLSIIDLSPAGHQPMVSPDGRYRIVFNGEVYNYLELKAELEALGEEFVSRSDTEVVLRCYMRWREKSLTRFVGMFAFVVWDDLEGKLFCARDFFGIKPFFYSYDDRGFIFASEIPTILGVDGVDAVLDEDYAYQFLTYGYTEFGEDTMLKEVKKLPPAHWLSYDLSSNRIERIERYWKIDLSRKCEDSFEEAAAKVRTLFLDSVKFHLRSDVPLGIALSGGIDSSAVACAARAVEPDMDIHTFSYVADAVEISEERWVDIVNNAIGAIPHKVEADSKCLTDDLDDMIVRLGEPFIGTSIYAQRRVFELAKASGMIVTLEGQGADELIAGYQGYPVERISSLIVHLDFIGAVRFFKAVCSLPGRDRKSIAIGALANLTPRWLKAIVRFAKGGRKVPEWIDREYVSKKGIDKRPYKRRYIYRSRDRLRSALANDATWFGLPGLLRHGDRNAMTFSIESRVPFLTKELAEYLLSLPEEYLVGMDGTTKRVFRKAMRGIVPDAILDRKDKIGFVTPERAWIAQMDPWVRAVFERADNIPLLDMVWVKRRWDDVVSGAAVYDSSIWRILNFIRWYEIVIGEGHVKEITN